MKSIVKFLATIVALGVMMSVPARAQDPAKKGGGGRGQQTPEQRIEAIETAVGKLTADQKTKITAILTKSAADMAALSQEDRRGKGADMRAAANKEIRALLTEEQAKKFDEMPQGGRGGGGGKKKGN